MLVACQCIRQQSCTAYVLVDDYAPTVSGRNDGINLHAICGAAVSAAGADEALRLQAASGRDSLQEASRERQEESI